MLPFFQVKWTRGSAFFIILFFGLIALQEYGWGGAAGFLFTIIGLVLVWRWLGSATKPKGLPKQ